MSLPAFSLWMLCPFPIYVNFLYLIAAMQPGCLRGDNAVVVHYLMVWSVVLRIELNELYNLCLIINVTYFVAFFPKDM